MREFLFRGKLIGPNCKGKWSYGCLKIWSIGDVDIVATSPDDTVVGIYGRVDSETVGQYTGLKDKNGNRVFEGDIIKYIESGLVGIVKFGVYGFNKDYGYYIEWINDYYGLLRKDILYWIEEGAIVVGNIHDNPELLEVKK